MVLACAATSAWAVDVAVSAKSPALEVIFSSRFLLELEDKILFRTPPFSNSNSNLELLRLKNSSAP